MYLRFHDPIDTPIAKGNETVKTMEEVSLSNIIRKESPIGITTFTFIPRSVITRPLFESPFKKTSCTIEELFMILTMVQLMQLDRFASCLAKRHKRKRLLRGNP